MQQPRNGDTFKAPTWLEYVNSIPDWWIPIAWALPPWWIFIRFSGWYSGTFAARSLRAMEPLGIAMAVAALVFTWIEVSETREERKHDRALREATLYAMAAERLDAARAADQSLGAKRPVAQKGQKRALEAMAEIGATIAGIDASKTNLTGVNLQRAILAEARFDGANLWLADFSESYLGDANLSFANLDNAFFVRTNLLGTSFAGADLRKALFRETYYLTQAQLDEACGDERTVLPQAPHPGEPAYDPPLTIKPCEKKE